jgi:tetratricopeptide (TPR) repeat protein
VSFIRLISNLRFFLQVCGHLREATAWAEQATVLAADLPLRLQARAWQTEASFAFTNKEYERATTLFRQALEAWGDGPDEAFERAWLLRALTALADVQGDREEADVLSKEVEEMFRDLGNTNGILMAIADRANFSVRRGDYGRARELLSEGVALSRELDNDFTLAGYLGLLAALELREHRYPQAASVFAETLECCLRSGVRVDVAVALRGLGATTAASGQLEAAARIIGAADRIDDETGFLWDAFDRDPYDEATAAVLTRANDPEIAAALAAGRAMSDAEAAAYALATAATWQFAPAAS